MDEATGKAKIVHGRNLDYPVEISLMREVLYKGILTKDGKELGTCKLFSDFQKFKIFSFKNYF